jgi:hypothetical protein
MIVWRSLVLFLLHGTHRFDKMMVWRYLVFFLLHGTHLVQLKHLSPGKRLLDVFLCSVARVWLTCLSMYHASFEAWSSILN